MWLWWYWTETLCHTAASIIEKVIMFTCKAGIKSAGKLNSLLANLLLTGIFHSSREMGEEKNPFTISLVPFQWSGVLFLGQSSITIYFRHFYSDSLPNGKSGLKESNWFSHHPHMAIYGDWSCERLRPQFSIWSFLATTVSSFKLTLQEL